MDCADELRGIQWHFGKRHVLVGLEVEFALLEAEEDKGFVPEDLCLLRIVQLEDDVGALFVVH